MLLLIVTDNDEEIDKAVAFELGADDYMTMPVSMREIQARVAARLRLASKALGADSTPGKTALSLGGLDVDLSRREVSKHSRRVGLWHKEFELLALLIRQSGRTLTRAELLKQVWGYQAMGSTRTVDVHVERVRKKIEDDPTTPRYIVTERSIGYRFEA